MTKLPRPSPPAAAAAYPPWVMLEQICKQEVQGCSSSIANTDTTAVARSTTGVPISVSLCLASPPEGSRVCVQHPADVGMNHAFVLAAHGDSVLVQLTGTRYCTTDHFVYNTGDATADPPRPPSLYLLPLPHSGLRRSGQESTWRGFGYLHYGNTGLLRRGEDEFVVAELNNISDDDPKAPKVAELHLLRSTAVGEWSAKRPPTSHYDYDGRNGGEQLPATWRNDTVIPFGDRLCWVDLRHGLMFADVFKKNPTLRYVPLPLDPCMTVGRSDRNVCVTDGGGTRKFVGIWALYCCDGDTDRAYCRRSHHAYTVRTWTLRMHDMAWVKDGRIDSAHLWSLDSYKGLPCVELHYPAVSIDDPHVICFVVRERTQEQSENWRIMVDMRSKTLRSAFRHTKEWYIGHQQVIPSGASAYLNSKPSSGSKKMMGGPSYRHEGIMQASSLEKILTALKEIPGLDRDDMLKAYHILQTSFGSPNGFEF